MGKGIGLPRKSEVIPRIVVLLPSLNDDPSQTIFSLRKQSVRPQSVLVICGSEELASAIHSDGFVRAMFVKPEGEEGGKRIARALNVALGTVSVNNYDYIVRVDADTVLPPSFIKDNLALGADLVGEAGFAMVIRTEPFLEVMRGKFEGVLAEDTYLAFKFRAHGKKVLLWATPPVALRKPGSNKTWRFFFSRGVEMYRLGYEPLHVLGNIGIQRFNLLAVWGYAFAALSRMSRYEFAPKTFTYQLANYRADLRDALAGKKFVRKGLASL